VEETSLENSADDGTRQDWSTGQCEEPKQS
jgi:hypothetical protein